MRLVLVLIACGMGARPHHSRRDETRFVLRGFENERCSSSSQSRSSECRPPNFDGMSQKDIAKWFLRQGTNRYKSNIELAPQLGVLIGKAGLGDAENLTALGNNLSRARKELSEETGEDWSAPLTQQKRRLQHGPGRRTRKPDFGSISVLTQKTRD